MNLEHILNYLDAKIDDLIDSSGVEEMTEILVEVRSFAMEWEREDAADSILYLLGKLVNRPPQLAEASI